LEFCVGDINEIQVYQVQSFKSNGQVLGSVDFSSFSSWPTVMAPQNILKIRQFKDVFSHGALKNQIDAIKEGHVQSLEKLHLGKKISIPTQFLINNSAENRCTLCK
jgi:hypothetical protein